MFRRQFLPISTTLAVHLAALVLAQTPSNLGAHQN